MTLTHLHVERNDDGDVRNTSLPLWFPILLGSLTAVAPVSTDIYLPALPAIEHQLHTSPGAGSLTMTAWVAGLALGQISIGPISDRFGRRWPLIVCTLGYALAGMGCALSQTLEQLCFFRVVAALMGAASLVVPNACIRDVASGDAMSRVMSRLIIIQGIVPIMAPAIGGFLLQYMSWRGIFWGTAIYGALSALAVILFLPDTLPPQYRRELRIGIVARRYVTIMRDPSFFFTGMVWMLQGMVVFTYLTAAPFLFEDVFGLSPFHYGMLFGMFAICMIGASQVNAFMLRYFHSNTLLKAALVLTVVFGLLFIAVALWSAFDLDSAGHLKNIYFWPLTIAMVLTLTPGGAVGPNAAAIALSRQAQNAGSAAALGGTGFYVFGIVATYGFTCFPLGTAIPMAGILFLADVTMLGFVLAGAVRAQRNQSPGQT
ncbi:multidrug effflux MFS transporter [Acetobacteraceae bacterium ESL0709]|nr:multidrug effflux MFS transporter [Acetobacteraceae bacterium ESL0697]MDF7678810.1 multidrug effflux MFS transporter [Acetobacteraceae bacterium ESL0709]